MADLDLSHAGVHIPTPPYEPLPLPPKRVLVLPISQDDRQRFFKQVLDPATEIYRRAARLHNTLSAIVTNHIALFLDNVQYASGCTNMRLNSIRMRPTNTNAADNTALDTAKPLPVDSKLAVNTLASELQALIDMCHELMILL